MNFDTKTLQQDGWHGIQGILFVNILLRKNNREQDKKEPVLVQSGDRDRDGGYLH